MQDYRLRIRPTSNFLTPLHSDTIFGSLCWIIRWHEGEDKLEDFLNQYKDGNPPLLVSSGFRAACLPFPTLPPISRDKVRNIVKKQTGKLDRGLMSKTVDILKKLNKQNFMPLDVFEDYCGNFSLENILSDLLTESEGSLEENFQDKFIPSGPYYKVRDVYHNMVNRKSNSTTDGELYSLPETTYQDDVDIYFRFQEEDKRFWTEIVKAFALEGFGSKKTSGKGQFEILENLKKIKLPESQDSSHFLTLSNYIPNQKSVNGYYSLQTKRGKLGSVYSTQEFTPWKKPLIFYEPGSVIERQGDSPYGKLAQNIHHSLDDVVQYGYAYEVGVSLNE